MKKILWIEDEAKDQLLELLGPVWQAGYFVDIAEDKSTALNKIKKEEYDAYVFDLIIKRGQMTDALAEEVAEDPIYGIELIREIFDKDSGIHVDPSKCAVFSVVERKKIHDEIKEYGITNIIVKKEMSRTTLKEIIESIIENGGNKSGVQTSKMASDCDS